MMKFILTAVMFLLFAETIVAQKSNKNVTNSTTASINSGSLKAVDTAVTKRVVAIKVKDIVDSPPEYVGGDVALYTFVYQRLRFPNNAEMVDCTVYVGFVVNENGSLSNIAVQKGFNRAYNEEAVRLVEAMPKWKAGVHEGKATKVAWVIPIKFKLN